MATIDSPHRPPRKGVVASASPQASAAGARVLAMGGNAVDAAIATSLSLGVTEPAGSGIGGQAMFLIAPSGAAPFALEGASFAPADLPQHVDAGDLTGRRAATVPTLLRTLDYAFRHHGSGTVAWSDLVAPAIESARRGFCIGPFRAMAYARFGEALRGEPATAIATGMAARTPQSGDTVTRVALGNTLERVAQHGVDDFYRGELAQAIARDMEQNGGWISKSDLANVPAPRQLAALHGRTGAYDVYSLPPPGSGWAVVLALQILAKSKSDVTGAGGTVRLAEAMAAAQRERISHPLPDLEHADAAIARKIDPTFAARLSTRLLPQPKGETTHFSVVDGHGTMVGVTQSLNAYFGGKVAHPALGFLYNNYMLDFMLGSQGVAHSLRPGAKPYSYMATTALYRDGRPRLMVGSAGDDRIITSTIQVAARWAATGLGIAQSVAAPRVHPLAGGVLMAELGALEDTDVAALERVGMSVMEPRPHFVPGPLQPYFGGVHAVADEHNTLAGGVDPRRDGTVELEP